MVLDLMGIGLIISLIALATALYSNRLLKRSIEDWKASYKHLQETNDSNHRSHNQTIALLNEKRREIQDLQTTIHNLKQEKKPRLSKTEKKKKIKLVLDASKPPDIEIYEE